MWNWIKCWIDRWICGRQKGIEYPEIPQRETRIPDSYWEDRWAK